jgi:hypothetical protein
MDTQPMQVINHNEFVLKGRFAGKDYDFPPEKPVIIPFDAMKHIFGFGLDKDDRQGRAAVLNRLGVLKLGGNYNEAQGVLFKVQFTSPTVSFDSDEIGGNPGAPLRTPGGESEVGSAPASADLPRVSFDELKAQYQS